MSQTQRRRKKGPCCVKGRGERRETAADGTERHTKKKISRMKKNSYFFCLFFVVFFPADPLPPLQHPPRLLPLWAARWPGWTQTALLPVSMLAPLARPHAELPVVGGTAARQGSEKAPSGRRREGRRPIGRSEKPSGPWNWFLR